MISKPHRTNSDFQLRNFFVGSCHTPDGAYALMYSERIALEDKLRHAEAQRLRRQAKIAAANEVLDDSSSPRSAVLNAKADIAEANADIGTWEMNLKAAQAELATINTLMAELEPYRKFSHLPLLEANEASQQEEWLHELVYRAQNFLLTQGAIPHDHFARMREHPQFKTHLLPRVREAQAMIQSGKVDVLLLQKPATPLLELIGQNHAKSVELPRK